MKKTIMSIWICMLLFAPMVPSVRSFPEDALFVPEMRTIRSFTDGNWTELQKLLASDGTALDGFGWSVSLSGDTALIGSAFDDDIALNAGSAYVFVRSGSTWLLHAKLLPSDGGQGYCFGYAVSLSGDTALIGEPYDAQSGCNAGSAYVFIRTGTTWALQQKILPVDGEGGDNFGSSVSLDGDVALIGAEGDSDTGYVAGSAYVFSRTGATWTQDSKLLASDSGSMSKFGCSVSLDGDTALVGAYWGDGNEVDSGAAYVFIQTGGSWTEQAKLFASDGTANDLFGSAVSLDRDTALIGSYADDDIVAYAGSAYVFTRTGATWTQQQKLFASDGALLDFFGYSVALSDDTAVIGAPQSLGNGNYSGSTYVFLRTKDAWTQQTVLLPSDGGPGDRFGSSVYLAINIALIGAFWDDDNGNDSGSAYVFVKEGGNQPPVAEFSWTPHNPYVKQAVVFDASASTDPDGAIRSYEWDWENDGIYDELHSTPNAAHIWETPGSYPVTVRVTDDQDATGTSTKIVNVSALDVEIVLSGGIGITAVIKNKGSVNIVGVRYQIQVVGGIFGLIQRLVNGTIDIAAGKLKTIKTSPLIGLGPLIITVTVDTEEKTAKGTQIFILTMIKP